MTQTVEKPSGLLFVSESEAAERLGVSRAALISAIQRGEVAGVTRIGRSVRIFLPALILAGLGTDAGTLAKQLGCKDLAGLIAFLGGEQ